MKFLARILTVTGLLAFFWTTSVGAANIYFPPDSFFSDDDLLVYGDGDPVYMSLGEWREVYGLHDIVHRAGVPLSRWIANATIQAAKAREAMQKEVFSASRSIRSASVVPEPGAPALLVLAGACALLRRRSG